MPGRSMLAAMAWLVLMAPASAAVDLGRIDRSVGKEPTYTSKQPQYCLLVFGPEATVRVWAVLDGDLLYLDRNGNSNLTDPGDRVSPVHVYHTSKERPDTEVIRQFFLPPPRNGGAKVGTTPVLSCFPDVTGLVVEQIVPSDAEPNKARLKSRRERPFWISIGSAAGWEQAAQIAFATHARDAPILHFFGPLQIAVQNGAPPEFRAGETAKFLFAFRSVGVGGYVGTYGVPATARALAEIEFLPAERGGATVVKRVGLKDPGG
jgi:hypothetical protein